MEDNTGFRNIKETYKIGETIGKGGFAFVRKAKHRQTG
jgi:serine/threonine protein kinase